LTEAIHVHPTAPLAERVLLPGDPGRALRLAQTLLAEPKMFNHNRGLWGYTGEAADGELLTIQSTGMGGPSAAIVVEELVQLGAQRIVRVGTCGALQPEVGLGELIAVEPALARDGTSRALGADDVVAGEEGLTAALDTEHRGPVVSSDLFYDPSEPEPGWAAAGALAVEMECAAVFTLAGRLGVAAAGVLAVSDLVLPERQRIDADALLEAELRLGRAAVAALSPASRSAPARSAPAAPRSR
jgi:uridine phosphorylase